MLRHVIFLFSENCFYGDVTSSVILFCMYIILIIIWTKIVDGMFEEDEEQGDGEESAEKVCVQVVGVVDGESIRKKRSR